MQVAESFISPDGPVLITDGGLATELEDQGHDLSDDLWSARLLLDAPAAIRNAHLAYFRAGAAIATTASYQASFEGFAERGIDRDGVARMLRRSVTLADEAREELAGDGRQRWVAASVGPYGAMLGGGKEYIGHYGLAVSQLREWHLPRAEILAETGADLLALETVPDLDEAEALVSVVGELDVSCWLTYTIVGGQTRAGQPLSDAFAIAADVPQVIAVGVNCCAPSDVAAAVSLAREVTGKPVIAYPNSGESWNGPARTWEGAKGPSVTGLAPQWVASGARMVGGCCRVTPADIAEITRLVAGDLAGVVLYQLLGFCLRYRPPGVLFQLRLAAHSAHHELAGQVERVLDWLIGAPLRIEDDSAQPAVGAQDAEGFHGKETAPVGLGGG